MEFTVTKKNSPLYMKHGVFTAQGFTMNADTVKSDLIDLKIDGVPYTHVARSFSKKPGKKIDSDKAFVQTMNAFFRDSCEYEFTYVHPSISALKALQEKGEDGLWHTIFVNEQTYIEKYRLDYATKECLWYSNGEAMLMVDSEGRILSDYPDFSMKYLIEDIEKESDVVFCSFTENEIKEMKGE